MKKYLYEDLYLLEEKHWWHISKREAVLSLIKEYAKGNRIKILDVGCGTGRNMEEFKKLGDVWGLDSSLIALNYCRKRGLKNLKLGSAENTSLETSSFDVVTLLDVLEHTDDNKTLKEMARILKRNGILILTVPAFPWLWSKWDEVLHHKRRYTINTFKKMLDSYDFHPVKMTYLYSFLVLPTLIIRKIKQKFSKNFYPSDFTLSTPLLNFILNNLSRLEFFLSGKFYIPFGTSIVVVAKKNDQKTT
ncbi:MAG: class I SAM-dependent methyltransferase [Patescibacteria group bacterium]